MGSSSPNRGEKKKMFELPPPRYAFHELETNPRYHAAKQMRESAR